MQPAGPADFDSTRWTLIERICSDSLSERRAALEELLTRYLPALQAHLILRRGLQPQDAADVVQDFVTNKILERDLVGRADRERGRFRAFLLTALDRYFIDRCRYGKAQKRAQGETYSIDVGRLEPREKPQTDVFDIAWGRMVLKETLRMMREGCHRENAIRTWDTFRLRVLEPMVRGVPAVDYEELIKRCGFESPRQASNALITARRRFFRCLRDVVSQYVTEDELDHEIDELRAIMSSRGAFTPDILPFDLVPFLDQEEAPLETIRPEEILELFGADGLARQPWRDGEQGQLLRHLLAAQLSHLLPSAATMKIPVGWAERSLGELYTTDDPPLELLVQLKSLGRSWARNPSTNLPRDLGAAVYFASIAAALVRHQQRITRSENDILREGFRQLIDRPWMVPPLKKLLEAALKEM